MVQHLKHERPSQSVPEGARTISIDECRESLGETSLSDTEITALRENLYAFAHAVIDLFGEEQ